MTEPKTLYETKWLKLQRIGSWDLVRRIHSDACVGILAITPEQEVVLVEQFRIPVQQRVIEIPAGIVGDEEEHEDESVKQTAMRELLEETGFRAGSMELLSSSPTSAGLTAEFTLFYQAGELTREHEGGGVSGEDIKVHRVALSELRDWLGQRENEGMAIDHKIHAALGMAGVSY
ncbi:MAG: NUDIX hydrolase [Akkermansiaceae bacterium]|nr:NUDIX hydrolase [Akkermansiaceae bacterium]